MIDIHSHILAGVDDGAQSLEDSVAMLRMAARHGTTDIVATPHANSFFRYNAQVIAARFLDLSAAAEGLLRVHLGCDFHLSYENVQDALQHPTRYTINNRTYLMVELPELFVPDSAADVLTRLRSAGMVPVITHPERNGVLAGRIDTLGQWVKNGCLVQITGQSLLGRFGPDAERCASILLRQDLVHFIASDAHDCEDRPPRLDLAHRHVAQCYGVERAERLCTINPGLALAGEPLAPPEDRPWYRFWK
jgi:protein-tyrosine phosphatase